MVILKLSNLISISQSKSLVPKVTDLILLNDLTVLKAEERVFPVLSNQKTNAYLKEIQTLVGLEKILTFHVARHTFATTVTMMNGVPIESVSRMLGHKDIKSTQHYARIVDTKIGNDMMDLANRIGSRLSFPAGYK
jgi:site-specific recombinase XerD